MTEPPLPNLEYVRAQHRAWVEGIPACWDWSPERLPLAERYRDFSSAVLELLGDDLILSSWQQDRCAICSGAKRLVKEHLRHGSGAPSLS